MAVTVAQGVGHSMFGAGSAACLPHRTRSIATQIFRTIRSCSSGKCWPQTPRVRARFRGHLCPGNGGARGLHSMSTFGRRGDRIWRDVKAVGHHDDDAASVLGTVQGSPLRSDRASARPSGLDDACAQMIGRHLRDGHHMLFPSGTSRALIHPSNGREKRSHMFDRFRTHAFHPLVEVHFSRFCPLTIVAIGASLFAFDGAATHHPPRSVTDAEQPLIVAHRAAINCAPRRGRSATNADHRRPRARPRSRLAGRSRRR